MAIAIATVMAGCGWLASDEVSRGGAMEIDLSNGPFRAGVPGIRSEHGPSKTLGPAASLTVRLPGGYVFEDAGGIESVDVTMVTSPKDQIDSLTVSFVPESAAEVGARIRRYADQFHLDAGWLDMWEAPRLGRPTPNNGRNAEPLAVGFSPLAQPDGPQIEVRTAHTPSPGKPYGATISFSYFHLFDPDHPASRTGTTSSGGDLPSTHGSVAPGTVPRS